MEVGFSKRVIGYLRGGCGDLLDILMPVLLPIMESDHESNDRTGIPGHCLALELRNRGGLAGKIADLEGPFPGVH